MSDPYDVPGRTDRKYLGDGVYANFDGYQIWLNTGSSFEIALEPPVLDALLEYRAELERKYRG